MTELDPEEEAVLESARRALSPPDVVTQRMRAALLVKVATPGIVVGASAAASSAAAATAAGSATATTATAATVASAGSSAALGAAATGGAALGAKVAVGAVFLKAAGVTTALLLATVTSPYWLPTANAPAPTGPSAAAASAVAPGPRAAPAAGARIEPIPAPPSTESADSQAIAMQAVASPAASEAVRRTPASSAKPEPRLEVELDLLRRAQQAIQAGQAQRALGLLTKLDAEHPKSSLGQEREVARVLALCGVGEVTTARQVAQRVLAASPNSLYARRIQASCAALPSSAAAAPPAEAPAPAAEKSTPRAPSVARFGDSGN